MKYETPELTTLTPAVNAIQGATFKGIGPVKDSTSQLPNETHTAYEDWE